MTAPGRAAGAIRAANAGDVERVAEIERASFSDPWSAGSFRSLLASPHVHFAVAASADGTDVCGYVVSWFVIDEAELANLAVAPEVRGRGVGAALLDAALAEAARRGAAAMYLEARDSNRAARVLYASRGFVEIGRRRRYYRRPVEDAVVMRRALAPARAPVQEE